MSQNPFSSDPGFTLPLTSAVLDRLGDILFATDEILGMIADSRRDDDLQRVEQSVRRVYDEVNELMKQLVD